MGQVQTFTMPGTDLVVPEVILGMMRILEKSDTEIQNLVSAALEVGISFFDHAAIYGGLHGCEKRFAEAVNYAPAMREKMILQSKCGIDPAGPFFDFSYDHIMKSVDESLVALGTDYLDILLLHRPDALVEPEEVARAFDELQDAGKVRYFGVSNQQPGQIELLKTAVKQPLIANQVQLSITHANVIAQGVAINMNALDQSIDRDNGVVDYCRIHDITVQAWSPFQAGFFDGPFIGSEKYPELNEVLNRLAAEKGVTPDAVAVAWILRHPANWQVVLGTTQPSRVRDAAAGSGLELTRPEWYELFRAAGHAVP